MKNFPVRKYPRLKKYDYSQQGSYFVTFCVKGRHEVLGNIVLGTDSHTQSSLELTPLGIVVEKTIQYVRVENRGVEVPQYIIMPNHVHMIIILNKAENDEENPIGHGDINSVGHGSPTLQAVVGRIKSYTAKQWSEMGGIKYQTFWQRSFYERIIRNEDEYEHVSRYIKENPVRWTKDKYYIHP